MRMGITKISILTSLLSMQEHCKKRYTCMKRQTIQDRLKDFYLISISLSAIDEHLGQLKTMGYFKLYQRRGRNEDGTQFNKASNRMLSRKCFWELTRLGIKISAFLFKIVVKQSPVFPKADKTPTQLQAILDDLNCSRDEQAEAYSALLETMRLPAS